MFLQIYFRFTSLLGVTSVLSQRTFLLSLGSFARLYWRSNFVYSSFDEGYLSLLSHVPCFLFKDPLSKSQSTGPPEKVR